jgi:hypothetical protein
MTMRGLTLYILLLAAPPAAWAGAVAAAPRSVVPPTASLTAAPLVELRGLLRSALSLPLAEPKLASGAPLLSLDPSKAGVLLERLAALPPQAPAASSPAVQPVPPGVQEVLLAVNSSLRDIPAERLRSLPDEEVQRLASVILDGLAPGREAALPAQTAALLSEAGRERVQALQKGPLSETQTNPYAGGRWPDVWNVKGVPPSVRLLSAEESAQVFRHYTSPAGLQGILSSRSLRNGPMAYVKGALHQVWRVFEDLTGIFLTLPGVPAGEVGVGKSPAYVDVKLPSGIPVLEIEPGRIYLIPLAARAKDELFARFLVWLKGGAMPAYEAKELEELDRRGGPGPSLSVPVEVVGRSAP